MALGTWVEQQRELSREAEREQGQADGVRRSLLMILRNKGQTLCPSSLARLEACDDVHQIERWMEWVLEQPRGGQLTLPEAK